MFRVACLWSSKITVNFANRCENKSAHFIVYRIFAICNSAIVHSNHPHSRIQSISVNAYRARFSFSNLQGSACKPAMGWNGIGRVPKVCTKLNVGDVCYSGGVETGPVEDYSQACPTGSACLETPGIMGIGGEVPKVCTRVEIAKPCPNPIPQLCMIRCPIAQKECALGYCVAKVGSCCQTECQMSSEYTVVKG